MSAVAVFVHAERSKAAQLAGDIVDRLLSAGHEVRLAKPDAAAADRAGLEVPDDELVGGLDLAVSIGGDGTMLRTVDAVARAGVPVLGVNVGTLGYLTDVEPEAAPTAVERVLAGDHGIEERMLLEVEVVAPSGNVAPGVHLALNEAVLEKTAMSGHTVRLLVDIDGEAWTPYAADGLILATPTGSTAYSFSARGPVVSPRQRATILTPVSPHMLFDRALVLDPSEVVAVTVGSFRPALLTVDGRAVGVLLEGDRVVCRGADVAARLVTFEPRKFHRLLKAKFGLPDR